LIIDAQIETRDMGDARVLEYLEAHGLRNCVDIGGVQRPWASRYVNMYVDLITPEEWKKNYPDMYDPYPEIWKSAVLVGDCDSDETWFKLMECVLEFGKFDFVICTQMAEHLSGPKKFFERLPMLADQGYVGVPNKCFELGRGREFSDEGVARCGLSGHYRGAFPHRWIYTIKEGVLWGFPKLSAVENIVFPFEDKLMHNQPLDYGQLGFFWEKEIPVRIVGDSDIGFPNPKIAIDFYRKELSAGL